MNVKHTGSHFHVAAMAKNLLPKVTAEAMKRIARVGP